MSLDLANEVIYVPDLHHPNPPTDASLNPPSPPLEDPPAAPEWDDADVGAHNVLLSWLDNSDNEDGFVIEQSPDGIDSWGEVAFPAEGATSFDITGLADNTTYFFRIRAQNYAGYSAYSANVEVATLLDFPNAPTSFTTETGGPNSQEFSWVRGGVNESGYTLYGRDVTVAQSFVAQADVLDPNQVVLSDHLHNGTGFIDSHQYQYKIRAFNDTGESPDSNVSSFTFFTS